MSSTLSSITDVNLIATLQNNGIAIIPTDTQYGIVGTAMSESVVERIYSLKQRNLTKPFVILIDSLNDLTLFNIDLDETNISILNKLWPAPVTVIFPCPHKSYLYLHREKHTLALRMPDKPDLKNLIAQTGPLVAPSANPEGKTPATTIKEAIAYFGDKIDVYVDGGTHESPPSTLIEIHDHDVTVLREGVVKKEEIIKIISYV